ncbi:amino acid ABC transporter permease [Nonomuraea dietziae]|uniref:Polar amino acid transport system permease protein n=1 Tax=Nonomuraea dietziae TaxID=65515 RepID=A0A7W5UVF8_9ACTN|nr:amino acid ABC transporter permease [Nonomuraea dietziae]MBB3725356.1 polar amino acid transport system permease protein [Nonomuraea dietziae]
MATGTARQGLRPDADIKAIPIRRPWRWAATALVLVLLAMLLTSMVTNPRYRWEIVARYLLDGSVLNGLLLTLEFTAIAMVLGISLGVLFAVMRGSSNRVLSWTAAGYIWFFRGTPLLVQLVFWFNLSALYPTIELGLPFGPVFATLDANTLITPFIAGVLGLALNEGAYMAEIVRAGIVSVPKGQLEAASSLGMSKSMTMRKIVLPQAMRVIIPPTGNNAIAMLKTSSLISVLAIPELLYSVQIIYGRNFQTIPLLLVASIWYLLATSILTAAQTRIERHFSPDRDPGESYGARLRRNLTSRRANVKEER